MKKLKHRRLRIDSEVIRSLSRPLLGRAAGGVIEVTTFAIPCESVAVSCFCGASELPYQCTENTIQTCAGQITCIDTHGSGCR